MLFQNSDEIAKKDRLRQRKFVTEKGNDPSCREVANIAGKPISVYSYERSEVLIRQARVRGALQEVILASLRAHMLYFAQCLVLAFHKGY